MRNGRHALLALALLAGMQGVVWSSPQAAGGAGAGEACLSCHEDLSSQISAPVEHPPARERACTVCHNPHVARFQGLLRERPGPLCLSCHDAVREEMGRTTVHAPVEDGRCSDCHEPHGGRHEGLLSTPGSSLCAACHGEVATWAGRSVQHPPSSEGECGLCHEPHGSDPPGLLRESWEPLCGTCHPVDSSFREAHQQYPVERSACGQCHDPHASARPGLLRESLHPPFADGDCLGCHALPGSPEPFRPARELADLCGTCHEAQVGDLRDLPFPHVGGDGGGCTRCHNPHTADGQTLLRAPLADLCRSCHDPGGAASGGEGRYLSHGGADCTICHSPHGGERPLLLSSGSVEMCAGCHEPQHTVSHPLGEESRDPRNGAPMTCLSCHAVHDAPYPKYLHRSADRELCVPCHRDLVGGS